MHQSIFAVLATVAILGDAAAVAPPGDAVSRITTTTSVPPGVAVPLHKARDDLSQPADNHYILPKLVGKLDENGNFLNDTTATNSTVPSTLQDDPDCKDNSATDKSRKHHGCKHKNDGHMKEDDHKNNSDDHKNKDLGDKPLREIGDCLGSGKDMVEQWCECMDNCDAVRAYWRALIQEGKNAIKVGFAEKATLWDDVCASFTATHATPISLEVAEMTTGFKECAPGSSNGW
jgi:hypothetical protein